jgi:hypothetical protein
MMGLQWGASQVAFSTLNKLKRSTNM